MHAPHCPLVNGYSACGLGAPALGSTTGLPVTSAANGPWRATADAGRGAGLRNGCDGCDGDGGGGARGSAVCGRGLTPAARPDGSGGATRQQPPAPPPPQAVAGRQWCLSRGDAEAGRAEAGRAETGRAEAGRADAGRPNGDAAFRRTAEVGRGLVGGCGSWPRPCGCRSGLQSWIQYDYRLESCCHRLG